MLISVIISTYNRPDALKLILSAFDMQSDREFEVIVADDGSKEDTKKVVHQKMIDCSYPITYVYQNDEGFRLARVRNLAAKKAKGEYLVFLDGDCVPRPSFISCHRKLAQKNFLVAGNRILLSQSFTKYVLDKQEPIFSYSFFKWIHIFMDHGINRLHPLFVLPYFQKMRNLKNKWKKARGCNFALFKEDYFKVDGCDSDFKGWGYEDSDLAIRLIHAGLSIKSGRYATGVLHLFHHENDRSHEKENLKVLQDRLNSDIVKAQNGISRL